jgi:hypothetical protein
MAGGLRSIRCQKRYASVSRKNSRGYGGLDVDRLSDEEYAALLRKIAEEAERLGDKDFLRRLVWLGWECHVEAVLHEAE